MSKKLDTIEVMQRLDDRYSKDSACILMTEVSDSTGSLCSRHADAVAMWLWPSKGFEIEGFEVKTSRQDLIKELNDVTKWEAVGQFCDRWWLVVGDKSIVKLEELPPMWGVMYPVPSGLKIMKPASKLDKKPVTKGFIASLLRKAATPCDTKIKNSYDKGFANGRNANTDVFRHKYENLQRSVKAFNEKSGLDICDYRGSLIGNEVKLFMENKRKYDNIHRIIKSVDGLGTCLKEIARKEADKSGMELTQ